MTPPEKFTSEVLPPSLPPRALSALSLGVFLPQIRAQDCFWHPARARQDTRALVFQGRREWDTSGTSRKGHSRGPSFFRKHTSNWAPRLLLLLGGPGLWVLCSSLWFSQARRAERTLPGTWRRSAQTWHMCRREGGEVTEGKGLLSCEVAGGAPSKAAEGGLEFRPQQEGGRGKSCSRLFRTSVKRVALGRSRKRGLTGETAPGRVLAAFTRLPRRAWGLVAFVLSLGSIVKSVRAAPPHAIRFGK